ncbi:hypothetical protein Hanom_Chr06g00493631 [Helianthus anomalus]
MHLVHWKWFVAQNLVPRTLEVGLFCICSLLGVSLIKRTVLITSISLVGTVFGRIRPFMRLILGDEQEFEAPNS